MAKVSIKEFRTRLREYIELAQKEPVEVTNWDKVVAIVYTPQDNILSKYNLLKEYVKDLERRFDDKPKTVYTASGEQTEKVFKEVGRCEKCRYTGTVSPQMVPMPNEVGDIVDVEMRLCGNCERNLKRFLT